MVAASTCRTPARRLASCPHLGLPDGDGVQSVRAVREPERELLEREALPLPTGKVLDIHANSASNGAPIQSWDFLGTAPRRTGRWRNMQIQSMGAMCVDPSTAVGTQLDLRDCSGGPKLTWNPGDPANVSAWANPPSLNTYKSRGSTTRCSPGSSTVTSSSRAPASSAGNKCLGVRGGSTAPGMPVGSDLRRRARAEVRDVSQWPAAAFSASGICLDAGISDLARPSRGRPDLSTVGLPVRERHERPALPNQQFNFYGQVRASWNRCMDGRLGSRDRHASLVMGLGQHPQQHTEHDPTERFFAYYR